MADETELLREISINIAIIKTKLEENEKLQLAKRVALLEKHQNLLIGALMFINFGLSAYVAFRK